MNAEATFCMDSGQIRCGDDEKDTFVKMLQQVTRVTPSMAVGIVSVYPSVGALVRAFEKEGPLILEDVMVCPHPSLSTVNMLTRFCRKK